MNEYRDDDWADTLDAALPRDGGEHGGRGMSDKAIEAAARAYAGYDYAPANEATRECKALTACDAIIRAWYAEKRRQGWKMVPVEATDSMDIAGADLDACDGFIGLLAANQCWSAMLAAAPEPEGLSDE